MPIFGNKDKKGNFVANFESIKDGIPTVPEKVLLEVTLLEDKMEIKQRFSKMPSIYLPYSKIKEVNLIKEEEIIEKSKSTVGRATVGGLLLGPLGAVIGGLDGTGKKNKKETNNFIIIKYDEDNKQIYLKVTNSSIGYLKFIKLLKEKASIPDQLNNNEDIYL